MCRKGGGDALCSLQVRPGWPLFSADTVRSQVGAFLQEPFQVPRQRPGGRKGGRERGEPPEPLSFAQPDGFPDRIAGARGGGG